MASLEAVSLAVLETDGDAIEAFGPAGAVDSLDAIEGFLAAHGLGWSALDLIGLDGKGDAKALARAANAPVAFDFGAKDIAAGGRGAPLTPVYYRARARAAGLKRPAAVIDDACVTLIAENGLLTVGDKALLEKARSRMLAADWGAEAVAYLAVRCWNGWPITFPKTTGAPYPMTGGRIARP
jgi:1,6-anhydro-N-acetylmuramate kinase